MVEILEQKDFFQEHRKNMFYVGFMKSDEMWFPLCLVSKPEENQELDSLFVSPSFRAMTETLNTYARQIPQVEQTFVQYLMSAEIQNLIDRFALKNIALVSEGEDGEGACGCGCGCGCS